MRLGAALPSAAVLVALLAVPGTAAASRLEVQGGAIVYAAAPGETNRVTVNWGGGRPTFDDDPAIENAMTFGPGCQDTYGDRAIIECPGAPAGATIVVDLGDGDDRAQILGDAQRGHRHELRGGPGNDELLSEEGSDLLDGGDGNDVLQPDDNDDGDAAGVGDVVLGGPGQDKLQLVDSPQSALRASLDGVADDGGPGEGDNYGADIEDIQGSRGASNTLVGTPGPNRIEIISDDRIPNAVSGGGGNDLLLGGGGNDSIDGGDGDDVLVGGAFDDVLVGGAGIDRLDGDGDTLYPGNDRIEARDGNPESINCGIGADTAVIDATDVVPADPGSLCEAVDRAAPVVVGPTVRPGALKARGARVSVRVACPAGVRCRGEVTIRTKSKVRVGSKARRILIVARGTYDVRAGATKATSLALRSDARSLLRRSRSVKVVVELRPRGAARATATRKATLRR